MLKLISKYFKPIIMEINELNYNFVKLIIVEMNKPDETKRKSDHIDLAFKSQMTGIASDQRFNYEPIIGRSIDKVDLNSVFMGIEFGAPIWISSMTGGAEHAKKINENLAKLCEKYNLGMGLGSCRQLLKDNKYLDDFNLRKHIGNRPLYANLGIAQLEEIVERKTFFKLKDLIDKLNADGLIIHVNPLQEVMQPEGDLFKYPPIDTIKSILDNTDLKIIVKEVGQGMGPESLANLLQLPIKALEFGAYGGSNFAKLEMLRQENEMSRELDCLINIGHNALEMTQYINNYIANNNKEILCNNFIISGGIKSFLDGYYLIEKLNSPSVYGMASVFLKYAIVSYEVLDEFMNVHLEGLRIAKSYLRIKK
jgi:isopentenyl-diphosphate delta-isomerase